MASDKFASFTELEVTYKRVQNNDIKASVLVPKDITNVAFPVLVHFHGGGLVMGDKMLLPWWATWFIQLATSCRAVVVSPNYRLLPESTVSGTLDDLKSFWTWLHESLPLEVGKISNSIKVDMQKIVVAGESAGGYLSIQSALICPNSNISVIISQYGTMLFDEKFMDQEVTDDERETVPESLIDDYIKELEPGAIRTSWVGDDALRLSAAFVLHGRYRNFLGNNDYVFLREEENAQYMPPIWIIQGTIDSKALVDSSRMLVERFQKHRPETPIHFSLESGAHGFDLEATMDDEWVRKGIEFLARFWP